MVLLIDRALVCWYRPCQFSWVVQSIPLNLMCEMVGGELLAKQASLLKSNIWTYPAAPPWNATLYCLNARKRKEGMFYNQIAAFYTNTLTVRWLYAVYPTKSRRLFLLITSVWRLSYIQYRNCVGWRQCDPKQVWGQLLPIERTPSFDSSTTRKRTNGNRPYERMWKVSLFIWLNGVTWLFAKCGYNGRCIGGSV